MSDQTDDQQNRNPERQGPPEQDSPPKRERVEDQVEGSEPPPEANPGDGGGAPSQGGG
jgi:hypothetical protein